MASEKKKIPVYLWALWPVLSAVLTILMLMIDTRVGPLLAPVNEISVVGALVVLAGMFVTGYAAFRFAKSGVGALKAALIGNAIPILCVAVFTVFVLTGSGESDTAVMISCMGTGIFQILAAYFTVLIGKTLSYFEVYIAFAALIGTFIVGYAVGFSKGKK